MRWSALTLLVLACLLVGCARRRRVAHPPTSAVLAAPEPPERGVPRDMPPGEPSAYEECGTDRRCRIARLRRAGTERQESAHAEARAQVVELERQRELAERRRVPRRLHPWLIETVITDHHFGAMVGLHAHPNFFFGLSGAYFFGVSHWSSESVGGEDGFPEWRSEGTNADAAFVVGGELRWLMFEEIVTPYLGLGFHALRGSASEELSDSMGWTQSSGGLDAHYLQAAAGIDVQFWWGLRFRAAFVVRPLVHVRVRDGMDVVLERAESGFRDGFRLFGAEGGLGWSM